MMIETAPWTAPATVVSIKGRPNCVEVVLPGGNSAWARLALPPPYRPAEGDQVLVISCEGGTMYVIGVLSATGPTHFSVPGNLSIDAPHGSITLSARGKVRVSSREAAETIAPRVIVRAGRFEVLVHTLLERAHNSYRWARDLFQVKGGRLRSVAEESYLVKTHRAHLKSEADFSINGRNIHLG